MKSLPVRNRAKELAELLGDVDKIKVERKRAKHNRNKYTGASSGSAFEGGSARYGGFGSESSYSGGGGYSAGGYTGSGSGGYSGGGDYGGGGYDDEFSDHYGKGKYDDDSPEEDFSSDKRPTTSDTNSVSSPKVSKQPAKEVNLFDFDEPAAPTTQATTNAAADDDWGNFSSGGVANGK
jgi:epsin